MMVSQLLKEKIESYYAEIRAESPAFVNARAGKMTPDGVAHFVNSARFLIEHTPIHLALAARVAAIKNDARLSEFFRTKIDEERGHDQWAIEDLEKLRAKWQLENDVVVSDEIVGLVSYVQSIIEEDPAQYLAYILFTEYLTVIAGPEWIDNLESKCGISRDLVSVIGNHAILDREHVAEDFVVLETLVAPEAYRDRWQTVLEKSMSFHRRFIAEAGRRGTA